MKKLNFNITQKFILIFCLTTSILSCSNDSENISSELSISKTEAAKNLKEKFIFIQSNSSYSTNSRVENGGVGPDLTDLVNQQEALNSSISVLNSFGITNDDIIQEFGSLNEADIITTALAATRIEEQSLLGNHIVDLETGYNYSTNSYVDLNSLDSNLADSSGNTIVDCAIDALGIPAGLIIGSAQSTSTAALLKAAKKLAKRMLGWVGAGIAIYEFGDCMDWW